jgi:hypothetical protein
MNLQKRNGRWQLKWRERLPDGEWRQCSQTFDFRGQAEIYDRGRKDALSRGEPWPPVAAARGGMTLAQFVEGPWKRDPITMLLDEGSKKKYAWALERHLAELLEVPLVELTSARLSDHQAGMIDPPKSWGREPASANTLKEVFMYLGRVLQVAAEKDFIDGNPAYRLRKAKQHVRTRVEVMSPFELERLLADLEGRDLAIALLGGHLGLRPIEIRLVPVQQLVDGQLQIRPEDTKPNAPWHRAITVPKATHVELRTWLLESGHRGKDPIVGPMTESALKQWGTKRLRPRVEAVTDGRIANASTKLLRHSHASMLHHAGYTLAGAADRMGHDPDTHTRYYMHVIRALGSDRYPDLDTLIDATRGKLTEPWPGITGDHQGITR